MSVDAYKNVFEHVELFNKPALFTNARIQRDSVPHLELGNCDEPGKERTVF